MEQAFGISEYPGNHRKATAVAQLEVPSTSGDVCQSPLGERIPLYAASYGSGYPKRYASDSNKHLKLLASESHSIAEARFKKDTRKTM